MMHYKYSWVDAHGVVCSIFASDSSGEEGSLVIKKPFDMINIIEKFKDLEASLQEFCTPVSELNKALTDMKALLAYDVGCDVATLAHSLPGADERVRHPVYNKTLLLYDVVIDLNDYHKWSRDEIADWIETLDIDTTFKVPSTQGGNNE